MSAVEPIELLLFDLDGTLIDTAPEIADALNDTLGRHGLPRVAPALVRSWIGDGARALLAKALTHLRAPPELAARAWDGFALDYALRCGSNSQLFDGARALLLRQQALGRRLALLTNKESAFAQRLLAHHDLSSAFDLVVAGDTLAVRKPHPAVVQHVLQALGVEARHALLVGDSITDVRTARAAGVPVWLVRHGYPQGPLSGEDAPDGFLDRLADLDAHLGRTLQRTAIA